MMAVLQAAASAALNAARTPFQSAAKAGWANQRISNAQQTILSQQTALLNPSHPIAAAERAVNSSEQRRE
jgi:hypothetical protein